MRLERLILSIKILEEKGLKIESLNNLLVATYFGIDYSKKDIDNKQLRMVCINKAYLDAARVMPYSFSTSYLDSHKKDCDVISFNIIKEQFKAFVKEELINVGNNSKPYCIINKICEYSNPNKSNRIQLFKNQLSFGMVQKWVNMYIKYLWLFDDKNIPHNPHMPIDSYIIDELFNDRTLTYKECINCQNSVGWLTFKLAF